MTDQTSSPFHLSALPAANARYYALMAATIVGLLIVVLVNPGTIDGHLNPVFSEGGFIEGLSPMGYVFCVVLICAQGGFHFAWNRGFSLIVVLIAMTLRELDFHTRFTVMSAEKLTFYTSSAVPLYQKAIALVVIVLIAWAALTLVFRHGRAFLTGLRDFDPVSVATLLAFGEIALSKGIDGIGNRLADIGIAMDPSWVNTFEKLEETSELGISMFAIIAILAYFGSARNTTGRNDAT